MTQRSDQPSPAANPSGPYERLGVPSDASFDAVQAAKLARLEEVGDDTMARSRIEAAYDAVLMERLKERQQGRVSSAAKSASQREQLAPPPPKLAVPALPQLPLPRMAAPQLKLPGLALASGRERWFPLATAGVLLLLLLLAPGCPPDLVLALATAMTVINLQWRNRRFLAAVGWGFGLLCLGLLVGAILAGALSTSLPLGLPLTPLQVQSLPALLLLLLGALLIGNERS
ncbi:CPP1-like family protein [Cyanobium sp. ATX 6E8]|uniref:CPP1-like family protein n=1 Tax=Cyanobium sp. ATX 6E8 TaxID=2823701 RepID=UPI0020CE868C|nr:CPP1-like family protein [Cyanobium sp. ATX 6E8]MCP9940965.1 CPP1-like family protein [Cyanobium sp. ATX 6E8]